VVKRKPREPGARSASEAPSRPRARSQTRAAVLKNAAKVARGGKKNPAEGDKKTENKTNKTTDKATETLSSGKASPKTPSSGAPKLTLVKKRPKGHIRLPFDGVRKARITTRRKLPARSYLLLTGEDPDAYWYYPAIALLLIGFIGFNLWSIRNYFKYIRPAEKRAQMGD